MTKQPGVSEGNQGWSDDGSEHDAIRKPRFLAVVPSRGVEETGSISYRFIFDANVPPQHFMNYPFHGLLMRTTSGKDRTAFWTVYIGGGEDGSVQRSVNDDETGAGLDGLIRDASDAILLVPPADIEAIRAAAERGTIELNVFEHDGVLSTS